MAKKRDGGSGMGVIVTLVFFVLATVILGVTTYFGFADQEANNRAKKEAVDAEKKREGDRNWYRFQTRLLRQYVGHPPAGLDAKDLAREKALFDKGQLTYAPKDKDGEEFQKFAKEVLDRSMAWDAGKDDTPTKTYEKRLKEKDDAHAALAKAADTLKKEKDEADRQAKEARDQLEEEKKNFKEALVKLDKKVDDDRKTDRETINNLRTALDQKGREKEKETLALSDTKKQLDAALAKARGLETRLTATIQQAKEARDHLDDVKTRYALLAEKHGTDVKAIEAAALDKKAVDMLREWTKDWRVVEMDRRGTMPYINLGSSDGLTPQVTFSVHARGRDGKLNPTAKGTLEVVRVLGPHLAQTRVTSVKDPRADPLLKGDRLFNPTWDPTRKKRVALAGIADLGGDGTDNTQDFRRLLKKQNVQLDAFIDTSDEKAPKVVGPGVSVNTDYLVLADNLESVNHPRSRDKAYVAAFDRLKAEMQAKANLNGVTVITLRRYLDMIGYRPSKVVTSNPAVGPLGGYGGR
jgi:hypothetical protein